MPCARKSAPPPGQLLRLFLEHFDEEPADRLALPFRIDLALQRADEHVGSVHMDQRQIVVLAEHCDDFCRLVLPHQAVVDEDAGELVADRLVDQDSGHRRVDAARKRTDHLAVADLLADRFNRMVAIGPHRPVALDAGDVVDEICQQFRAVGRVHHLGVELHGVEVAALVGDRREGRARRRADDPEALGDCGDTIAVAHPDLMARALGPDAIEQRALFLDFEKGAAKFAVVAGLDLAAELGAHGLFAVADAEHRNTRLEDRVGRARAADVDRGMRTAGKDDGFRLDAPERLRRRTGRERSRKRRQLLGRAGRSAA